MFRQRAESPSNMIAAARLGLAVACLALFGCSNSSSPTPFYTQRGVLPPTSPQSLSPAAAPGPLDGTYSGPAIPVQTGGGRCALNQQITGFQVSGSNARYSGFQGTIDSNGGVQMQFGLDTITGRFRANTFVGQMVLGQFSSRPTCTYALNLTKAVP
jgi:hypothetical protein